MKNTRPCLYINISEVKYLVFMKDWNKNWSVKLRVAGWGLNFCYMYCVTAVKKMHQGQFLIIFWYFQHVTELWQDLTFKISNQILSFDHKKLENCQKSIFNFRLWGPFINNVSLCDNLFTLRLDQFRKHGGDLYHVGYPK